MGISLARRHVPNHYGTEAQAPLPPDASMKLDKRGIKRVQQTVGSILYYARAVNMTVMKALNLIAVEQTKSTVKGWHNTHNYWTI